MDADLTLRCAELELAIECEQKLSREYLSDLNTETARRTVLERRVERLLGIDVDLRPVA